MVLIGLIRGGTSSQEARGQTGVMENFLWDSTMGFSINGLNRNKIHKTEQKYIIGARLLVSYSLLRGATAIQIKKKNKIHVLPTMYSGWASYPE